MSRPNIMIAVGDIAEEICPALLGCEERELDARTDARKRMALFRAANIVRYMRMGLTPNWIPKEELASLAQFHFHKDDL